MRSILSLVIVCGIALGGYYFYLKNAAPEPGTAVTQAISTTGVEMDLNTIAQTERMYYAQNGSYGSLDQLQSSATMNINRDGRDGYSYDLETSGEGFTVTARHPETPVPAGMVGGAKPLHYPSLAVDQSMQVHQID